ncbi:MAG: hypothetical protein FWC80_03595 [Firmicutes bacterium]|nr:hypothetical protein [Bacillota bacterium]
MLLRRAKRHDNRVIQNINWINTPSLRATPLKRGEFGFKAITIPLF